MTTENMSAFSKSGPVLSSKLYDIALFWILVVIKSFFFSFKEKTELVTQELAEKFQDFFFFLPSLKNINVMFI